MMASNHLKLIKSVIPYTLPVFTGYAFLGIAFGILMSRTGLSPVWTFLMSSVVFAGALQFAGIGLLIGAFNPIAAFTLALMVNIRHLFYGLSMINHYRDMGRTKFFTIFSMADEAFSINVAAEIPEGIKASSFYFLVSLLCYGYWNGFSLVGHLLGSFIPPTLIGFDFVLTALFYILFLNQWKQSSHRPYLSLGLASTLLALILVGKTQFLLVSMGFILLGLLILKGKRGQHD